MTARTTALRPVGIHTAMTQVFSGMFSGPSWASWRTVAKAMDGAKLGGPELALWKEHTGRSLGPSAPARELWLCAGRKSGKSRFAALVAAHAAVLRRHQLSPGERGVAMLLAADRKQARNVRNYVRALLAVPALARVVEKETAERIVLRNGVEIEVHTCSYRTVRGYTAVAVIADEIAFWRSDELGANPDSEVIAALRPALATTGGPLVALSSPYARRGELWRAFEKHHGRDGDPAIFWQAATRVMNPNIPASVVEEAIEADPSVAAAEWGGEFRRDVESFVSLDVIEAATDADVVERRPVGGHVAAVDPAGGSGKDSMTLAVAHQGDDGLVYLDALREVRPPFSPEAVVAEFAATLQHFGCSEARGDAYAGSWPSEQFSKRGVSYTAAGEAKSAVYIRLLPLLNSGRVRLLDHERLRRQLVGLERRTARGGKDSIDHGPGGHDDLANAAALAIVAAHQGDGAALAAAPQGLRQASYWTGGGFGGDMADPEDDDVRVVNGRLHIGAVGWRDLPTRGRW